MRVRVPLTALLLLIATGTTGCRFSPTWDESLYPPCATDGDCRAGCSCAAGHCLPQNEGESCVEELCLGETCGTGESCEADGCRCTGTGPNCGSGEICCPDATCVDTTTWDDTHCGDCTIDCTVDDPPPTCVEGNSVDRGPRTCAGGDCVPGAPLEETCTFGCDEASGRCYLQDPCATVNCGVDGTCEEGLCTCYTSGEVCDPGETCCGPDCTDTSSSSQHCGQCYLPCNLPSTCIGGICRSAPSGCDPPCGIETPICCMTDTGTTSCQSEGEVCDNLIIGCLPGGCAPPETYCCINTGDPNTPFTHCAPPTDPTCDHIPCLTPTECPTDPIMDNCCQTGPSFGPYHTCMTMQECGNT